MKLDYTQLHEKHAAHDWEIPALTLWRHLKTGGIYETVGLAFDTDRESFNVLYRPRAVSGLHPSAKNNIVFSRPISEWTRDRFEFMVGVAI